MVIPEFYTSVWTSKYIYNLELTLTSAVWFMTKKTIRANKKIKQGSIEILLYYFKGSFILFLLNLWRFIAPVYDWIVNNAGLKRTRIDKA